LREICIALAHEIIELKDYKGIQFKKIPVKKKVVPQALPQTESIS
jgi:hypothetical protein